MKKRRIIFKDARDKKVSYNNSSPFYSKILLKNYWMSFLKMLPQLHFDKNQITRMMMMIHKQELLPQPPNKLPKQSKLKPPQPQPPFPNKSNKNMIITIIHKLLSSKNLKSSIILPPNNESIMKL